MRVRQTARGLEVWAPAKLNLFLEVLGKRADGFHEIETLMVPIDWYDTLSFAAEADGSIELTVEDRRDRPGGGTVLEPLPVGPSNLAVRAVERLRQAAGVGMGARMHLVKRIPLGAGLGGGSADAAAALRAAHQVWGLSWAREELAALAAELGSDVPFFLSEGAAVCRGRGDQIEHLRGIEPMHVVVAHPGEGLSTGAVYAACHPASAPRPLGPLIEALRRGAWGQAARWMHNALAAPAAGLSTAVRRWAEEFGRLGAVAWGMSGSGTSFFAVARHQGEARRMAGSLASRGLASVRVVTAG